MPRHASRPLPFAALLTLLLAAACGDGETEPPGASSPAPEPTAETAANGTYAGIYDEPITLDGGAYEGEPFVAGGAARPSVGLLDEMQQNADLDGDGVAERYVLLWESSGGSGTNLYLARVDADGSAAATLVGNRVQVRAFTHDDAALRMEVLRAGPDDAMCCPGELATLRWVAGTPALQLAGEEVTGRLGLDAVAGEWRLVASDEQIAAWLVPGAEAAIDRDEDVRVAGPDLPDFEITLALTADGQIAGRSACNQYSGRVTFSAPNVLAVGPLALTMMACPEPLMRIEREYLRRLQNSLAVGFQLGDLALYWGDQDRGDRGALRFER